MKYAVLSKKLWTVAYKNPSLRESSASEVKAIFSEAGYENLNVTDLLVTETDEGNLVGVKFYFWVKGESYAIAGGYFKINDRVVFKILETEEEAKKLGTQANRPVQKKLDKQIEDFLGKSQNEVKLPPNLLNLLAPDLKNFEAPDVVKTENERNQVLSNLLRIWSESIKNFLNLLPKSSQAIVGSEIDPKRISTKRSKNPYAHEFFAKVAPSFLEIQEKIKNAPRDRKKEIRDVASGFSIGDKVEFKHPTYGEISGVVAEFKDGKIGVRHKNIARMKYVTVGTEITFVDASDIKYSGPWKGPSSASSKETIASVKNVLLKITDKLHGEIVSYFEKDISAQIKYAQEDLENVTTHRQRLIENLKTKRRSQPEIEREENRIKEMKNRQIQMIVLRRSHSDVWKYFDFLDTSNEKLEVLANIDSLISKDAEIKATKMEMAFVAKQLSKLSSIIDQRQDFSSVKVNGYSFSKGVLEADLTCTFGDDSFVVHSILVYVVSSQGKPFYRYPTTFHDVVLDDKKFKKVDERWMNEVFTKSGNKEASVKKLFKKIAELERLAGENEPTNPSLWDRVQKLTKGEIKTLNHNGKTIQGPNDGKGFKIFPSAYANGWASKTYKDLGGGWKKKSNTQGNKYDSKKLEKGTWIESWDLTKKNGKYYWDDVEVEVIDNDKDGWVKVKSKEPTKQAGKRDKGSEHGGLDAWFAGHGQGKSKAKGKAPYGDWVAITPVKNTVTKDDGSKKTFKPGDIVGPCGISKDPDWKDVTNNGKDPLKCMPRQKAHDLDKSERAELAKHKRRQELKNKDDGKPVNTPTFGDKANKIKKSHELLKTIEELELKT